MGRAFPPVPCRPILCSVGPGVRAAILSFDTVLSIRLLRPRCRREVSCTYGRTGELTCCSSIKCGNRLGRLRAFVRRNTEIDQGALQDFADGRRCDAPAEV